MSEQITLFDLPSKGHCACWSLNPWKTRLALNFKGVDYKTVWVEYPDIKPTLESHVPPNTGKNTTPYTIPTVLFPSPTPTYIMDSIPIAAKIEELHPTPSLHLDSPLNSEVQALVGKINVPIRGIWMPKVPTTLLNEKSVEYFERTRAARIGSSLEEFGRTFDKEAGWKVTEQGLHELADKLRANGGPYFLGKTPSYADFICVGFLQFYKRIDKEDLFDKLVAIEPVLGELYEACGQWLKRDDH